MNRRRPALAGRPIRLKPGQHKFQGFGRCRGPIGRQGDSPQGDRLVLDHKHRTGCLLDEFHRHTAEREAVEGAEALTADHQEPIVFGCAFQDRRRHAPFFLTDRTRKFQRRQLLGDFLEGSC